MKRALLVEDSQTDTAMLSGYLKQAGLQVTSVSSGEEGQQQLHMEKPDLIVLDVILPGQSGFEFCREVKSNPETKRIPVIICSTKGTDVDKMYGDMLGADAYFAKPLDQEAFMQTVRRLL
ncbi:response regulator [Geitlerinema sp. PCC 9228]|jgi:DNA-binding response OmpR family regulator|uniref:response regulator transcription factor n=1 Tax=Geitlerinema sp. PCC 9228 TaxID=111611 RepID=UPI0008F9DBE5|nr:response regulator [Geitlerinema sp. PCC 9228]